MKVKVIVTFRDRENGMKLRKEGSTMEVSKDRAERLMMFGYVKPFPDLKEEKGGGPASPEETPG